MHRIDALIADRNVYYDPDVVEGFISFCENEMTLTDGDDLTLLPSFKLWAEQLLGWYKFVEVAHYEPSQDNHGGVFVKKRIKRRLKNKQFIITSRGSAKSLYASLLQSYFLNVDTSTTQQITTAPTMKQAEEVINPIATAISRSRGPLFKFLTEGNLRNTSGSSQFRQKLAPTKKGIENFITNSYLEIRPMSISKVQGARPKVTTIDEWLSCDIRENVVGAIEQGADKVSDYVIVAISSEGTVRNGAGDDVKLELLSILRGEYSSKNTSIFYYKLDSIKEVQNPDMWIKASPNIGYTVSYDTYHAEVEKANKVPSAKNDILAKRFGIPSEGHSYYFKYEETIPQRHRDYDGLQCSLGLDLSQGDDFCAFTFLFPLPRDRYAVKVLSYITDRSLYKLPVSLRAKYDEFLAEGSLRFFNGPVLDMVQVYDDVTQFIEDQNYIVESLGYDPYNAKEFIERWCRENTEYGVEKVFQGAKTETVPLGELKHLAETKSLLFDQNLMSYCMGNAITLEDTNGNRKLLKKRQDAKIDNVAALIDAWVAYKLHRDSYV